MTNYTQNTTQKTETLSALGAEIKARREMGRAARMTVAMLHAIELEEAMRDSQRERGICASLPPFDYDC